MTDESGNIGEDVPTGRQKQKSVEAPCPQVLDSQEAEV